ATSQVAYRSRRHTPAQNLILVRSHQMITAVVLNWKREQNVHTLIDALGNSSDVGEIIVWNNHPKPFASGNAKVRVINSYRNFGPWARHVAGLLAMNEDILL